MRDRAASMGALGPCGRELCCSSFLSKYGNVSIKMAKNQNLSLNYSKLNGVCGQLKCCLSYEEDVYTEKRKKLPQEGELVQTRNGDNGKVTRLNILNEQFDMLTDKGKVRRFTFNQVAKKHARDEGYKFPNSFDNISDDTGTIIGDDFLEAQKQKQIKRDFEKIEKRAKKFALERLIEISDFLPEKEAGEREKLLLDLENESLTAKEEEEVTEDKFISFEAVPKEKEVIEAEPVQNTTETKKPYKKKNYNKNRPRNNKNPKKS